MADVTSRGTVTEATYITKHRHGYTVYHMLTWLRKLTQLGQVHFGLSEACRMTCSTAAEDGCTHILQLVLVSLQANAGASRLLTTAYQALEVLHHIS